MNVGSAILDTAIFSLVASALREVVELVLKKRAKELEAGIRELLHASRSAQTAPGDLAQRIYGHPLVNALYSGSYESGKSGNLPSYIPASNFALALMDEVVRGRAKDGKEVDASSSSPPITLLNLRLGVDRLGNIGVQRVVLAALDTVGDDLSRAQASIEAWYDSAMDRVSGRYKRHTQRVLLGLGLLIAVVANVNPIRIARFLYHDKTARDVLVAQAGVIAKDSTVLRADAGRLLKTVDSLHLPLGWPTASFQDIRVQSRDDGTKGGLVDVFLAVAAWMMTALAISFGAPFWFDLLNKVMVIRSTVKPHEKSPEEGSEDGSGGGKPAKLGAAASSRRMAQGGVEGGGATTGGNASSSVALEERGGAGNTWADGSTDGVL